MANSALAVLETALRARQLDRTLTTALAPLGRSDPSALAPAALPPLDAALGGGLPRGQLSELAGPLSSGRLTLALQLMAAATGRGELAALVDTFDRLDAASAAAAGVDLERLLWIRGETSLSGPASPITAARALDRAIKALNLVLQAGGFGLVAIDLGEVPWPALQRLPHTTWLRLQRVLEGRDTAGVLIVPQPLARSAGGLTLTLGARPAWAGTSDRSRRLAGTELALRIVSPRRRLDDMLRVEALAHDSH